MITPDAITELRRRYTLERERLVYRMKAEQQHQADRQHTATVTWAREADMTVSSLEEPTVVTAWYALHRQNEAEDGQYGHRRVNHSLHEGPGYAICTKCKVKLEVVRE